MLDLLEQQLAKVEVPKVIHAYLLLQPLGCAAQRRHHDAGIQNQEIQTWLRVVDILCAPLHLGQVSKVQLLHDDSTLYK